MDTIHDVPTRPVPRAPQDQSNPASTTAHSSTRARSIGFWGALVAAPVAVGFGVEALFGSRRAALIAGGVTAGMLGAFRWQLTRLFTDEPDHAVERIFDGFEIRRYAARIEARTTIESDDFDAAIAGGFRRVFEYIRGANTTGESLAMTAPVLVRGQPEGVALAMGGMAPVSTEPGYSVAFVMPPDRTMDTLPQPTDIGVRLYHTPERRVAVRCFNGSRDAVKIGDEQRELARLVAEHGLKPASGVIYAGFDPPTTLAPLRRNEIWIELTR